jgi:FimV-like protein
MKKAPRSASHLFQRSALWAALLLSFVGGAQALTLSRPVVQSKQGEALRAEIDIREISPAEQVDFQASQAGPEVYKSANNSTPLDLQIQLLHRDSGKLYLKVSSKQVVNSNVVDLWIDLRWATGRLLRNLSLSMDDSSAPAKSINGPAFAGSGQMADSAPQLRVKRGDTASNLTANQMPDGVSLEQMLVALLHHNPDAFVESNVNRLKEGALLTLPTEQEAKAVSRDEAHHQIQVQTKDFQAYRAELAAHAPGGATPKAARDSAGKLDAKVQNNSVKANQDKLTLAKAGNKDATAEEKIAQQRAAQDVAARAAELSRNMAELGKIAAATATGTSEPASGALSADMPASAASDSGAWLNELREHSLTPVGAGGLVALLVAVGLWRRRALKNAEGKDSIQGLPPLDVKFNLDLPEFDSKDPVERADIPNERLDTPTDSVKQATRPTLEMPNISLDLDDDVASPYQIRMDLADELWNLGQLHTSRALMEEVANDATGADKEKALKWLAERG